MFSSAAFIVVVCIGVVISAVVVSAGHGASAVRVVVAVSTIAITRYLRGAAASLFISSLTICVATVIRRVHPGEHSLAVVSSTLQTTLKLF